MLCNVIVGDFNPIFSPHINCGRGPATDHISGRTGFKDQLLSVFIRYPVNYLLGPFPLHDGPGLNPHQSITEVERAEKQRVSWHVTATNPKVDYGVGFL